MHVGILTFHGADNYGAVLQAYALGRVLADLGTEPCCIDYRPTVVESAFRWNWKRGGLTGQNIVNQILAPKFRKFRQACLTMSPRRYATLAELKASPPAVDVAVFGSDQIWNPGMFGGMLDPAYFGLWGDDSISRVVYSASFGGSFRLTDELKEQLATWLAQFREISVREESGADLVEQVTGARPAVTLDPTLLVSNYDSLIEPCRSAPKEFIFVFAMQYSDELKSVTRRLATTTKLPVLVALSASTGLRLLDSIGRPLIVSPGQWLWLIRNAVATVTNSFHAVVFSLIFKRRPIVVPLVGAMAHRNDRIYNILKLSGKSVWIQHASRNKDFNFEIGETNDDGARVLAALEPLKENSISYLKSALSQQTCKN